MKSSQTDIPQYQKSQCLGIHISSMNTNQTECDCCREQKVPVDSDIKFAFEHQPLLLDCHTTDPCSLQDSAHLVPVSLLFLL
jgi:hypothetical protein